MRQDDSKPAEWEELRGEPTPTLDNLIRWERIKLRDTALDAVRLLEGSAQPTREYLDYMFSSDAAFGELRQRMDRLRERIAELEAIRDAIRQRL